MIHGLQGAVSWGNINQNWPRKLKDSNIHVCYSYWVIKKISLDGLGQVHRCYFKRYVIVAFFCC